MDVGNFLKALKSTLLSRMELANAFGKTFEGTRDFYKAMGYSPNLSNAQYRFRYRRNSIAARIVEAYPNGTWRGLGAELIEDEKNPNQTPFEKQWEDVAKRLKIWPTLRRADILAGLGRYSVVLWGAPGKFSDPLPDKMKPEDLVYLKPFAEDDATVGDIVTKGSDPRFGQPEFYDLKRLDPNRSTRVHWSRVTHVTDNLLDDDLFSLPRLERVWNNLDDLDKIIGAGSEAFWLRAHQGYNFNLDKDLELTPEGEQELKDEVDEFINGIRRATRTRGMEVKALGSDVATFDRNVTAVVSIMSSGTGIPSRILLGSEQGQLASEQDRVNWAERIQDRRNELSGPYVVDPMVVRFIDHGILPPVDQFFARWLPIFDLSDEERARTGARWAEINQKAGERVVTPDEIRDRVLGLGALPEKERGPIKVDSNALPEGGPNQTRSTPEK